MYRPLVSIVILTKNPGINLKRQIGKILKQNYRNFELIVIDSHSTDGSLKVLNSIQVKLISIKPSQFGHGKTRNLGCFIAKGEIVVFLTQDSIPQNSSWLDNLLNPFKNQDIAAVYGRQIPRKREHLPDRIFTHILYPDTPKIWKSGLYSQGDNIFSDANSAVRRNLLLKYPYHHSIIVSEDYEWANRIMRHGYQILYEPQAIVIHSHTHDMTSLFRRNFDIGVSYRLIKKFSNPPQFIIKGIRHVVKEIKILQQLNKLYYLPVVLVRDIIRLIAILLGQNETIFPKSVKKKYMSAQEWYWG